MKKQIILIYFSNANGYSEESNVNKYLTLVPPDESKDKLKKYKKIWSKIKRLIRSANNDYDDYDEKYMKIKFSSDDNLPPKTPKSFGIKTDVSSVFNDNNKFYPQVFLNDFLYKLAG